MADLPGVEADLKALPNSDFILDSELLLYAEEQVTLNNPYKPGDKIERMDMASFLGKEPAAKFRAVCRRSTASTWMTKTSMKPQTERLEALHRLLNPVDTLHLKEVESRLVHIREEFEGGQMGGLPPHSEGAMVKVATPIIRSRALQQDRQAQELQGDTGQGSGEAQDRGRRLCL